MCRQFKPGKKNFLSCFYFSSLFKTSLPNMSKGKMRFLFIWHDMGLSEHMCAWCDVWTAASNAAGGASISSCIHEFSDRCCNDMISPVAASSPVWCCYSDCGLSVGEARVEYEGVVDEQRGRNRKWSASGLCVPILEVHEGVCAFMSVCLFVFWRDPCLCNWEFDRDNSLKCAVNQTNRDAHVRPV